MLSAILFDLDGTLANTDPIHFKLWHNILKDYDIELDQDFYQKNISGNTNAQVVAKILPTLSAQEGEQMGIDKEAMYRKQAKTLSPTPGLEKIIALTDQIPLRRAVVTNAPRENAEHMLEALQLTETFPIVVVSDDAPPGKPDPAPYKLGLEKVGVASSNAIAFEDSTTGICSAVAAGIYTIGVASTHDPKLLLAAGANMVIKDFNDPQLWAFLEQETSSSVAL
ncbi:haloacid dehalogenase superfamily protein, subfamily IA, variant 3 with third motif having DD or ED [Xenococcus sp. PCC 7305]|uniref:HAD family hydrolase n=1 Tax=Xenococcus sp. PCC 7305 TaxID=102125 RepID=UPI0002ACE261|nr:HAD-IA family hydrolase [Xenococcus sp. PCC 7305]ELS02961.1 haloacid dehalogenase superfamily protein, subfamily IA, variant 3 with third motif having DD or ED [Xenococcus sp. PCC 7305]